MLCASAWIPKGVSKTKFQEAAVEAVEAAEAVETGQASVAVPMDEEPDEDNEKVGIADVLADDLDGLKFHKSNRDDPYIKNKDEVYDEDELDDMTYRDTDMPLVALRAGEDISQMEVYIYEDVDDDEPNLYLHHETVLPAFPLCVAWSSYHPTLGYSRGNLAAVGSFLYGIDVWDLNDMDSLEPLLSLGGHYVERSKVSTSSKKKKKAPKIVPDSHTGEVMSVSWNPVQNEYLASGAADKTVKLWDVESGSCVQTLAHHSDKVQAVTWHPTEESLLLSASFDKTVQTVDVRSGAVASKFSLTGDAEKALWITRTGAPTSSYLATTEDGFISQFDMRKAGGASSPVWSLKAFKGAASACSLSANVDGLLVAGSVDKTLKVFDIQQDRPVEVSSRRGLRCGAIFDIHLSADMDHPLLASVGGSIGSLKVIDFGVVGEADIFNHFKARLPSHVVKRTERRIANAQAAREAGDSSDLGDNDGDED